MRRRTASLQASAPSPQPSQQPQMQKPEGVTFSPAAAPQPRPLLNTNQNAHNRSSSFFGFRNKGSNADTAQRQPSRSVSTIGQATTLRKNVDEHGRTTMQPTPGNNSQRPPQNGSAPTPSDPQPAQNPRALHPEIRSVVHLNLAHAHKVYFSGPLVRRIERQADGQRPTKDEGWVDVWGQLGGTTLSVWDMKEIAEASKQGKEVPPTYVNMTDAVSPHFCFLLPNFYICVHSSCKFWVR